MPDILEKINEFVYVLIPDDDYCQATWFRCSKEELKKMLEKLSKDTLIIIPQNEFKIISKNEIVELSSW